MATPESAPAEPMNDMTPLEYMDRADQELAVGNDRKAAALLWKAAEATYIGLARERGLDYGNLFALAQDLQRASGVGKHYYTGALTISESLRDHGLEDDMERYELETWILESFYESTRKFVVEHYGGIDE